MRHDKRIKDKSPRWSVKILPFCRNRTRVSCVMSANLPLKKPMELSRSGNCDSRPCFNTMTIAPVRLVKGFTMFQCFTDQACRRFKTDQCGSVGPLCLGIDQNMVEEIEVGTATMSAKRLTCIVISIIYYQAR